MMGLDFEIIFQEKELLGDKAKATKEILDDMKHSFDHSQVFRTKMQIEASVLNDMKHFTPDAKFWQAAKEQYVMATELVRLSFSYRRNRLNLSMAKRNQAAANDILQKDMLQIDIDELEYNAEDMRRIAADRMREIEIWNEIKKREAKSMAYSTTDCGEHQMVSFTKRWIIEALTMGPGAGPAERFNIISHACNGIRLCKEHGKLDEVKKGLPCSVLRQLDALELGELDNDVPKLEGAVGNNE